MQQITVIFSSKCEQNSFNLIESIHHNHSNPHEAGVYELFVYVMDKTTNQNLYSVTENFEIPVSVIPLSEILALEDKYEQLFKLANCSRKIDSIQRTRIQQQIFVLENYPNFKESIIWQVDDDMLFAQSRFNNNKHSIYYENNYFADLTLLKSELKDIDCIIAPSTFTPPIPSLLYCRTQLTLLFNAPISDKNYSPIEYHDYYSKKVEWNELNIELRHQGNLIDTTKKILLGYPVISFATNIGSEKDHLAPSRLLRGGNFIVLNPEIYFIPHIGYVERDGLPARRSDMIHAHLLSELGFDLRDTNNFSLIHNRNFTLVTINDCIEKYHADMIGSLLVQYLFKSTSDFRKRLEFHKGHIRDILNIIQKFISKDGQHLIDEIVALEQLDRSINKLNEVDLANEFEKFEEKRKELKLYANWNNWIK